MSAPGRGSELRGRQTTAVSGRIINPPSRGVGSGCAAHRSVREGKAAALAAPRRLQPSQTSRGQKRISQGGSLRKKCKLGLMKRRPTKIQHSTSHTEVYFPSREQETEKEVAKLETKKGAEYRENDERGVNGKRGWSGKNIKKILEGKHMLKSGRR